MTGRDKAGSSMWITVWGGRCCTVPGIWPISKFSLRRPAPRRIYHESKRRNHRRGIYAYLPVAIFSSLFQTCLRNCRDTHQNSTDRNACIIAFDRVSNDAWGSCASAASPGWILCRRCAGGGDASLGGRFRWVNTLQSTVDNKARR